jgi:hypothetical protein
MAPARRLASLSAALLAVLAVLAVIWPAGTASAAGRPAAGNRVWAISSATHDHAGADRDVSAGERLGEPAPCPKYASGACVAPEAGTGAFLPGAQGGEGLGSLAGRSINVSDRGLAQVTDHLGQFDPHPPNDAMIGRLSSALANGQPVTGADASFYMHELAESTLMRQGLDYATAHGAALAKYGVSPFSVYAPEVIQQMPEYFNSNWFDFWGISR